MGVLFVGGEIGQFVCSPCSVAHRRRWAGREWRWRFSTGANWSHCILLLEEILAIHLRVFGDTLFTGLSAH